MMRRMVEMGDSRMALARAGSLGGLQGSRLVASGAWIAND